MGANSSKVLIVGNPHSSSSSSAFLAKFSRIIVAVTTRQIDIVSGDEPPSHDQINWIQTKENTKLEYAVSGIRPLLDDYKYVIVIATPFVPPVISSKLLRSTSTVVFIANKGENKGTSLLSRMNAGLADQAVIEESNIAEYWDLDEQNTKIGATFVPNKFKISTEYNERSPAIGYIGGLSERKGVDVLLRMIEKYDSQLKNFKFLVGGTGPLSSEVEKVAQSKSNVQYEGYVEEENLVEFYNKLSLLVLPTKDEGLPNVLLEAMACGTPVLSTPVGAIPNIITDGEIGWFIDQRSPDGMVEKINHIFNSNRSCVSENSCDIISNKYRFEHAVVRYENIIKGLE